MCVVCSIFNRAFYLIYLLVNIKNRKSSFNVESFVQYIYTYIYCVYLFILENAIILYVYSFCLFILFICMKAIVIYWCLLVEIHIYVCFLFCFCLNFSSNEGEEMIWYSNKAMNIC